MLVPCTVGASAWQESVVVTGLTLRKCLANQHWALHPHPRFAASVEGPAERAGATFRKNLWLSS